MSQSIKLAAKTRKLTGRKVKQLRAQDIIPANIFGSGVKSHAIQISSSDFTTAYQAAGETSVIDIDIEGQSKTAPVLVHQIQRQPATDEYLHVDFLQVDLKKKVTAQIPVEITGESPAVKDLGGVMLVTTNEIEVEALPNDLPDQIKIDISSLESMGDQILVSSLKLKGDVTLLVEPDTAIVLIQEPKVEAEPEVSTESEDDGAAAESDSDEADAADSKSEAKDASTDKSDDSPSKEG